MVAAAMKLKDAYSLEGKLPGGSRALTAATSAGGALDSARGPGGDLGGRRRRRRLEELEDKETQFQCLVFVLILMWPLGKYYNFFDAIT